VSKPSGDDPGTGAIDGDVARIVSLLGLHSKGSTGYLLEYFRSPKKVELPQGPRAAASAVKLLMPAGSVSVLHRMKTSDEVWHYSDGDPIDLHFIDEAGGYRVERLGPNLDAGERPQIVVAAGILQAAVPRGKRWALCSCTVVPGFDIADVDTPSRAALLERFPQHAAHIVALTHA
jgi:predicted cupin superfamily sugar epimerase